MAPLWSEVRAPNAIRPAFLQLNVHRLVLEGHLLVVDVENGLLASAGRKNDLGGGGEEIWTTGAVPPLGSKRGQTSKKEWFKGHQKNGNCTPFFHGLKICVMQEPEEMLAFLW